VILPCKYSILIVISQESQTTPVGVEKGTPEYDEAKKAMKNGVDNPTLFIIIIAQVLRPALFYYVMKGTYQTCGI
jgi:hypothetical protein